MKKLIICEYSDVDSNDFTNDNLTNLFIVDENKFYKKILKEMPNRKVTIVTNNPLFLSELAEWNEVTNEWEVYIKRNRDSRPKSVHELTDKILRSAHNIFKIYMNDGFELDSF